MSDLEDANKSSSDEDSSPPTSPSSSPVSSEVQSNGSNSAAASDDEGSDYGEDCFSGAECSPSSSSLAPSEKTSSPPSSPARPARGQKRGPYGTYKDNPTHPIPRQTLDRWAKKRREAVGDDNTAGLGAGASAAPEEVMNDNENQLHHGGLEINDDNSLGERRLCERADEDSQSSETSSHSEAEDDSDNSGCSAHGNESDDGESSCEGSVSDDQEDQFDDESLYPGCKKTTDEAISELVQIYFCHNLSKGALRDIIKSYTSSLPPTHNLPTSDSALLKYVEEVSGPLNEIEHFYCRPNLHPVESKSTPCQSCGSTDVGVFYELPLEDRVQFLFKHRDLAKLIDSYSDCRTHKDGCVCDILDGSEYKRIWSGTCGQYKLTLILSTDGVSPYKSSKAKMWLLLFTIMELPPHLRSSFTVVWGVWFDKKHKPDMNLFLKPFTAALAKIEVNCGISWQHPQTGKAHHSLVRAPVMVADAPARAGCLNCQEHQAKYACPTCEQKTSKLPVPPPQVGVKRKKRKRRFLFREDPADLRTHQKFIEYGNVADNSGEPKRGVKGATVMKDIPHIDLSACVLGEYMHCVLLGVVKQICTLWFFVKGRWYIGDNLPLINDFLCNEVHPPDFLSRLPRSLDNFVHFKANEFRSFLLFFSLIVVALFLKDEFFQHWLLLVQAIFSLLTQCISENDLLKAEAMLRLFVRDIGLLYGDEQFVYNVHLLIHLVLYVRRFGPLWANSAFSFENFNGLLSRMIHGSKNEGRELLNQLWHAQGAQILQSKIHADRKREVGLAFLGKPLIRVLSDVETMRLRGLKVNVEDVQFYNRVSIGRELYSSIEYDKNFKRRNSYVQLLWKGEKIYGRIIVFCKIGSSAICLLKVFRVVHTKFFFHRESLSRLKHTIPVEDSGAVIACETTCIQQKLIQVGDFLCFPPNSIESFL